MTEPVPPSELWAGRYLTLWNLPGDGWSDVVVAEDIVLDRLVEIRLLAAYRADDPVGRARFSAAIHAAASVHHPALVAVYDKGEHLGRPYMVCERAPGPTLGQILAAGERLTPQAVARTGAELAEGLAAAHRAGVVHGAIDPNVIVLRPGGGAKLAYLCLGPDRGGPVTWRTWPGPSTCRWVMIPPLPDQRATPLTRSWLNWSTPGRRDQSTPRRWRVTSINWPSSQA